MTVTLLAQANTRKPAQTPRPATRRPAKAPKPVPATDLLTAAVHAVLALAPAAPVLAKVLAHGNAPVQT